MTDTAVKGITLNKAKLLNLPLDLPPVEEQARIAAVLDGLDEAIRGTERVIAKLQQIKQGLLGDLLTRGVDENGHLRPQPLEAPHLYKDSPLGRIPKEWEVACLDTRLSGIDAGKSPDLADIPARVGEWGVLKVSAVRPEGFQSSENKVIHDPKFVRPELEVHDGDLLITRANTYELVGLTCLVRHAQQQLLLCDKTLRLRVNSHATPGFVFLASRTASIRRQIEINATGSSGSMKNIGQQTIRSLVLPFPSVQEQERLCNKFESMDGRIEAERATSTCLRGIKEGLLHDLLTGRVRVPAGAEVPA